MLIETCSTDTRRPLSQAALKSRLSAAIAFCEISAAAGGERTFRSQALENFARSAFPRSCRSPYSNEMVQQLDQMHAVRRMTATDCGEAPADRSPQKGRLLIVNWRNSLFDGACRPISHGFLNEDCLPGWDTWLCIASLNNQRSEFGLVCWIPASIVELANDAVTIDAARCMSWLTADGDRLSLSGWGVRVDG